MPLYRVFCQNLLNHAVSIFVNFFSSSIVIGINSFVSVLG